MAKDEGNENVTPPPSNTDSTRGNPQSDAPTTVPSNIYITNGGNIISDKGSQSNNSDK